jgi:hypothetical protein
MAHGNTLFRRSLQDLTDTQFHLIGLALALRTRVPPRRCIDLVELALQLAAGRPKRLIAQLYGVCPPGAVGCLAKLPDRLMTGRAYLCLMKLLREPRAAKILWHADTITPNMIAVLDRLDPALRTSQLVHFLRIPNAVDAIDYLTWVVSRFNPDLNRSELLRSLLHLRDSTSLERWFERRMMKGPLPPPPWEGTDEFRPLRTTREIASTGRSFINCLQLKVSSVLMNRRYYYVKDSEPHVVCELVNDPVIGWSFSDVRGVQNSAIPRRHLKEIAAVFREAGFSKLPNLSELMRFDPNNWSWLDVSSW